MRFVNSSPILTSNFVRSESLNLLLATVHRDGTLKVWSPNKRASVVDEFYFKQSEEGKLLKEATRGPDFVYPKMTFKDHGEKFSKTMKSPWAGLCPVGSSAVGCADLMVVVTKGGKVKMMGMGEGVVAEADGPLTQVSEMCCGVVCRGLHSYFSPTMDVS